MATKITNCFTVHKSVGIILGIRSFLFKGSKEKEVITVGRGKDGRFVALNIHSLPRQEDNNVLEAQLQVVEKETKPGGEKITVNLLSENTAENETLLVKVLGCAYWETGDQNLFVIEQGWMSADDDSDCEGLFLFAEGASLTIVYSDGWKFFISMQNGRIVRQVVARPVAQSRTIGSVSDLYALRNDGQVIKPVRRRDRESGKPEKKSTHKLGRKTAAGVNGYDSNRIAEVTQRFSPATAPAEA